MKKNIPDILNKLQIIRCGVVLGSRFSSKDFFLKKILLGPRRSSHMIFVIMVRDLYFEIDIFSGPTDPPPHMSKNARGVGGGFNPPA